METVISAQRAKATVLTSPSVMDHGETWVETIVMPADIMAIAEHCFESKLLMAVAYTV
jgi:hypothetical protein